jgi:hypothetical protein
MLENLSNPAPKIETGLGIRPGIEFNGNEGEAQTPGLQDGADFKDYLQDAGFNLDEVEIIGPPRLSRWQVYDGSWRTAYKFRFRLLTGEITDLPLLYKTAKSRIKKPAKSLQVTKTDKALVVLWSDLQVGKAGASRGGTEQLIERVTLVTDRLISQAKSLKPSRIIFCDVGDMIEGFESGGNPERTNDLSLMQQVDLAATMTWEALKGLAQHTDEITYLTVGSNHCAWRRGRVKLGDTLDDWGVHIGRTLARLAKETELPIKFYEPEPTQESLAFDVFDDKFHIIGLFHGHQAARPDNIPAWIRGQMFGHAPTNAATIYVSGHFHHLIVKELGNTPRGSSRYWIQCKTLDNGSDWFRAISGEDSAPGLVTFTLEKEKEFSGTVNVL